MTPNKKLKYSLIANIFILSIVSTLVFCIADDDSKYFRFGPQDDLFIISIKINTIMRYIILLILITIIKSSEVIIHEIAMPVLGFTIYNPDKKYIVDFTKNELQFYANSMYMISSIRDVFMTLISISQIDIAIYNCFISELTGVFTVRFLLNEKEFTKEDKKDIMESLV